MFTTVSFPVRIARRDQSDSTRINLMIALVCVAFLGLVLVLSLALISRTRRLRALKAVSLPQYEPSYKNHRGLTIQTGGQVLYVSKDGQPMLSNPRSPPHSPDNVPAIHITFPDEHDSQGRRKSGRVLVVRVGEAGVGLEPVHDQLPAYEKESAAQFYSIDMDSIGGLKEKGEFR